MKIFWKLLHVVSLTSVIHAGVQWKVDESTNEKLVISIHFDVETESDLEPLTLLIGLPSEELPTLNIEELNKQKNPIPTVKQAPRRSMDQPAKSKVIRNGNSGNKSYPFR